MILEKPLPLRVDPVVCSNSGRHRHLCLLGLALSPDLDIFCGFVQTESNHFYIVSVSFQVPVLRGAPAVLHLSFTITYRVGVIAILFYK